MPCSEDAGRRARQVRGRGKARAVGGGDAGAWAGGCGWWAGGCGSLLGGEHVRVHGLAEVLELAEDAGHHVALQVLPVEVVLQEH